jgi:hypothetical protein
MSNHTTDIIREVGDFFIASTEDGRLRVGIRGDRSVDTPHRHNEILAVAAIENGDDFEDACGDLAFSLGL